MFARNHLSEMKWFEGVVENRQDPLKLGRVQVRIIGMHTDLLTDIPEEELLWSNVMLPVTSATMNGIGQTPALVEGTHVIGFFRDGDSSQDAIIIGSVPGIPQEPRKTNKGFYDHREDLSPGSVPGKPIYEEGNAFRDEERDPYPKPSYLDEPDTNRLARNEKASDDSILISKKNTRELHTGVEIATETTYDEPPEAYNSQYPYNKVIETESGHVIEMDDTPGSERVLIAHRSGAYVEMYPDGKMVLKTTNQQYNHVGSDRYEHTLGTHNITVDTNGTMYVKGDYDLKVDGNVNWNIGGNVTWNVTGGVTWNITEGVKWDVKKFVDWEIKENVKWDVKNSVDWDITGGVDFDIMGKWKGKAGPEIDFDAAKINLN